MKPGAQPGSHRVEVSGGVSSEGPQHPAWRHALSVAAVCTWLLLPLQHCHLKGSDELAILEMTRSIADRGSLSVPAIRHTEIGRGGERYSYFSPALSIVLVPFVGAARIARAVLPDAVIRRIAGPPRQRGPYRFGGDLETSFATIYAPMATCALLFVVMLFQRSLGVSRRNAALLAGALAGGTYLATMTGYLLRHTTEAALLLAAVLAFHRYREQGCRRSLLLGACLACLVPVVRVPAAVAGPALALYLGHALWTRSKLEGAGDRKRLLRDLGLVTAPLVLAFAFHAGANVARWGGVLGSPMVGQYERMGNTLGTGLAGLLVSPGSSVFVYSPLLLLAPFGLSKLMRRSRPEALVLCGLALSFLLFFAAFDGWSGLWSAPGPRYVFLWTPLLLAPLGLWMDAGGRRRALAVLALALPGAWVQLASSLVRWGSVPRLAGYPILSPDQSGLLFDAERAPAVFMSQLLVSGGPYDAWLHSLWTGWEGVPGSPALVLTLLALWAAVAAFALRHISSGSMAQEEPR